jgi:hypothetical protein
MAGRKYNEDGKMVNFKWQMVNDELAAGMVVESLPTLKLWQAGLKYLN